MTPEEQMIQALEQQRYRGATHRPFREPMPTQDILDMGAISTMFFPGIGELAGGAADYNMYKTDPTSHTPLNYGLTALGAAAPVIPGAAGVRAILDKMRGMHNTTESGVRWAAEMGGIPAPSMAVIPEDEAFMNFGEISLVGNKEMLDPANPDVKMFESDVFSPRQPRKRFEINPAEAEKLTNEMYWANMEAFDDIRTRQNDAAVTARKLRARGIEPEKKVIDVPGVGEEQQLRNIRDGTMLAYQDRGRSRGMKALFMKERGELPTNFEKGLEFDDYLQDAIGHDDDPGPLFDEFMDWSMAKLDSSFGDPYFTKGKSKKKIPYTLENLNKAMTGKTRAVEEAGFGGKSAGAIRAGQAKQFKSTEEARRAMYSDRGVVDHKAFERAVEETDNLSSIAMDSLHRKWPHEGFGTVPGMNEAGYRFGKVAKKNRTKERAALLLRKEGFDVQTSDQAVEDFMEWTKALFESPTEYFETKMQRPVALEEFTGAVVPEGREEIVKMLKDKGLQVETYPHKLGHRTGPEAAEYLIDSRRAALMKLKGTAFAPLAAAAMAQMMQGEENAN